MALKENLIELIALTQFEAQEKTDNDNVQAVGDNADDDEMTKFMKEINEIDKSKEVDKEEQAKVEEELRVGLRIFFLF